MDCRCGFDFQTLSGDDGETNPTTEATPPTDVYFTRKRCPECAGTVLGAAKVCRHCGYRFEPA